MNKITKWLNEEPNMTKNWCEEDGKKATRGGIILTVIGIILFVLVSSM